MEKTQKDTENRRSVLNRTQTIMGIRYIIISIMILVMGIRYIIHYQINADFDDFLISVIFSICQYFMARFHRQGLD